MIDKRLTARLNVCVTKEIVIKARIKALQEGTNLSRLVRLWLAEYLIAPPQGEENGTEGNL